MPAILVTGATGYVGGRLVPRLLAMGASVRVMARDPSRLAGRAWLASVEVVGGDVLHPETLPASLAGVDVAYYLVHSMRGGPDFARRDAEAAAAFGRAAAGAGVRRIVYLGGLGDASTELSHHLRSRQDCGHALAAGGVPVTEFRAGVVVGSGSVSFEMVRYLTERLPAMICPRWVSTRAQPIAIRDVLSYLVAALTVPESEGRVIELGGADVLTYGEMMKGYAAVRGLRRWLVSVPFLTPRLSSYWVHLITPIPADIARPLIDGLRNEVVVRDGGLARRIFPGIEPSGYREAVRRALDRLTAAAVETSWSDALAASRADRDVVTLTQREGMMLERREMLVHASADATHRTVCGLGGARGWPSMDWAWKLRGALDRLVGGVGLRRGRRHPNELRTGDALDFWRVEAVAAPSLLRLRAEMKVPGEAWLEFRTTPEGAGSRLVQTAIFAPKGLWGHAYWKLLYPFHAVIFGRMVRQIAKAAEARESGAVRGLSNSPNASPVETWGESVARFGPALRPGASDSAHGRPRPFSGWPSEDDHRVTNSPLRFARARAPLFLFAFSGGCLLVGALAALSTVDGVRTWYRGVAKPSWTPPDVVFGPVWTVLYLAMGFASWRVWQRGPSLHRSRALTLFGVQLAMNAAWSPIFFALHRPAIALVVIIALDIAITATISAFRRVDGLAAVVLAPYLLWCLFATALNAAIVRLAS